MTASKSTLATAAAIMKTHRAALFSGTAAVLALAVSVHAQEATPVVCGGPADNDDFWVPANDVSFCEVDQVIGNAGQALQIVREDQLIFGQIPRPGFVGYGSFVDYEADPAGDAMDVRYEYNPDYRIPAGREYVQPEGDDPIIRVVKGDRAWNEEPMPGMNPTDVTDESVVPLRQARIWLTPHGIIAAAAFTEKGLCPGARLSSEDDPATCPENQVSVEGDNTINVTLDGLDYVATLGDDDRPERIETTVDGTTLVATFGSYRNGTGMGGSPSDADIARWIDAQDMDALAEANAPLDKFRAGVYYPEQMTLEVNGNAVLDIEITQGWVGKYSAIFPDPELVRAAQ